MFNVLIVDDDITLRFMLKRLKVWETHGFQISGECSTGDEALSLLAQEHFDFILTDIKMPGMDGLAFLEQFKLMDRMTPVVLASTYSEFEFAQRGLRLGAFDYILKPISEKSLEDLLGRVKIELDEQILKFYPPLSNGHRLKEELVSASDFTHSSGEAIFNEVSLLFEGKHMKVALVLESICLEIWEELLKDFPYLNLLEVFESPFKVDFTSLDTLRMCFYETLDTFRFLITKYELHHPNSLIPKACNYLMSHIEENVSMEQIAYTLDLNKDYFGKCFKQITGIYFNEFSMKIKLEYAKFLLRDGQYKNYEISERLGFSSPDYFTKRFKEYTGMTPMQYKKDFSSSS